MTDTKEASPFAVVLQRELAQASVKNEASPVDKAAAATTTATDAAPPSDGLAALLLTMATPGKPDASSKQAEKKPASTAEDALQGTAVALVNSVPEPGTTAVITPPAVPVSAAALVTPATDPAAPLVTPVINPPAMQVNDTSRDPATDHSATSVATAGSVTPIASAATAPTAVPVEPLSANLAALQTLAMGPAGKPDAPLKTADKKSPVAAETDLPPALGSTTSPASTQAKIEAGSMANPHPDTAISAALSLPTGDGKGESAHNFDPLAAKTPFENQLLTAQTTLQTNGSAAPAVTPLKMEAPVGTQGWNGEFGEKVVWMVGHQQQRAELVLNPPALGRVEVTLSMTGDHANASFVSANPAVRDALEAALPRLRETLADAGINLGQANVGSQSSNQYTNQQENWDNPSRSSGNLTQAGNALRQIGTAAPWLKQSNSLVDVFA